MDVILIPILAAFITIIRISIEGLIMPALGFFILAIGGCRLVRYNTFNWLGIGIFLVYIGGLIVLFAYFLCLSSVSSLSGKTGWVLLGCVIVWVNYTPLPPAEIDVLHPVHVITRWSLLLLCAIMLFYALIIVVSNCYSSKGPLRVYFMKCCCT